MPEDKMFYLVSREALPEVLKKAVDAKQLLEQNRVRNTTEAIKAVNISRGAFYKYRDLIKPFHQHGSNKRYTFFLVVKDITGVLSEILSALADEKVNILTINQNIPINSTANITITVDILEAGVTPEALITKLGKINGVKKIDIVSA